MTRWANGVEVWWGHAKRHQFKNRQAKQQMKLFSKFVPQKARERGFADLNGISTRGIREAVCFCSTFDICLLLLGTENTWDLHFCRPSGFGIGFRTRALSIICWTEKLTCSTYTGHHRSHFKVTVPESIISKNYGPRPPSKKSINDFREDALLYIGAPN